MPKSNNDQWQPDLYADKHSFVWKLASPVIELLAPEPSERVLDIGCGTGQLTARIAESGATAVGADHSPAMIEEARQLHPQIEFQIEDAHDFEFDQPFDAVFSNAALHWITNPDKVVNCIARALNKRGRMAVEFGGSGNIHFLAGAIETASQTVFGKRIKHPWYFPDIVDFGTVLRRHGLEVTQAALIDRPTPLEGNDGLRNWVKMFGQHWLTQLATERHDEFLDQIESIARANLFRGSIWQADYRRIRVVARKR